MAYLTGKSGDRIIRVAVEGSLLKIGRGPHNQVDLGDRSVSRQHAELSVEEARLYLRDLESGNGTWVNGRRISERVEIHPGDRLRFGNIHLLVADDAPPNSPEADDASVLLLAKDRISTQTSLTWEEARSDPGASSRFSQMLLRAVTEAGQMLVLPRPLNETFDLVLDVVEGVIPLRRILLLLTDTPDGSPVIRAARPQGTGEQLMLSQTILGTVLHDRQAMLLNDVQSDPRFSMQESIIAQNLRSAMVAPLFDNQQVIGLLYADSDDPRTSYDRDQLRAFTLLANLIAVKITNARLLEAQREQERMAQEVAAAASVQRTLLQGTLPQVEGYEIAAHHLPCHEVGGDLYDVTPLADGRVALVVGDVSGKGMGAALLMSNVLAGLRVLYQEDLDLAALASRIDRQLFRSSDETHFVTLFVGLLDPRTHALEYVNAGHNPAMLFHEGSAPGLLAATGIPLGMLPGTRHEVGHARLAPESLLCVFSDGFPEAAAGEEFFGDARLRDSLHTRRALPLSEIIAGTLDDLTRFVGGTHYGDDLTLLLLRRAKSHT
ncbi:MAG: SpoIIE family protein phosphatase [Candidatus Eisenbacteria bacterium]